MQEPATPPWISAPESTANKAKANQSFCVTFSKTKKKCCAHSLGVMFCMDMLAEALAASLGGLVSATTLYPIEICKNRLQGGADSSFVAAGQAIIKARGIFGLFDGVSFSITQSMLEKFFYFYAYAALRGIVETMEGGGPISGIGSIVIGYLSEFVHLPVTMPVETIMIRIQNKPTGQVITFAESKLLLANQTCFLSTRAPENALANLCRPILSVHTTLVSTHSSCLQ
jgi:hypothetical protein